MKITARGFISISYNVVMSFLLGFLATSVIGGAGLLFTLTFNLMFVWPTATRIWDDQPAKFLWKF